MRFLHRQIHSFEDVTRNFEQIEQQNLSAGSGVPKFVAQKGAYYFRTDDPGTANHRIYVQTASPNGATWTGIL